MSGTSANTVRAEDPADFGPGKQGTASRWLAEIKQAEKAHTIYWERGDRIEARYMDERPSEQKGATRFNVLWSNVQTLKPAIYATPPKPVVQRRYLDQDPVARAASTILQRAIQTMIESTGWHEVTDQCVLDYLLSGRGTPWVRYEPHFERVGAQQVQAMEATEDGMQPQVEMGQAAPGPELARDADNEADEPNDDGLQITNNAENEDEITYEEVCWDYVFWKDFLHSPARTWQEVRWVARRVLMTREEGVERFGAKFKDVGMTWRPKDLQEEEEGFQLFSRAVVYEIWDKPSRKVVWISPGYSEAPLDEKDDFLKLNEFFPCPRPLYATLTNASLIPAPDFKLYQDQADQLDELTARQADIARDVKVAGLFDAKNDEIQRLFQEGHENKLIGVANWSSFSQAGGFKGAVDWLPLEAMVIALREIGEVIQRNKTDLYEITGIADIVRGQGQASATATAERLKGQFAQLRLRDRVQNVARFCRDMVRISGELIAKHFQPQTLLLLSDYQQTIGADPQTAMAAIQLLKNDQTRGFRIEIEVDSTVIADQMQEQEARVAFLQMAGNFLREAVPLAQQVPALAPLAGQMLLFGIRGFPVGRELETVFESALEQLAKASATPPEQPPDPALIKAQLDAQTSQQEMQFRAQELAVKTQAEKEARDQQAALEAAKLQVEQMRIELDRQKADLERARMDREDSRAESDRALKSQDMALKQREASAEREFADITAVQDAVAAISDALSQVQAGVEEAKKMGAAPRRVTIERGPDGRAIGARQEVEAMP